MSYTSLREELGNSIREEWLFVAEVVWVTQNHLEVKVCVLVTVVLKEVAAQKLVNKSVKRILVGVIISELSRYNRV